MVAMGFSVVAMIRVGNQKGKSAFRELRRIAFSIFLLSGVGSVLFALGFLLFRDSLPYLYLDIEDVTQLADNMEVLRLSSQILLIAAIFQISDSIQVVALGALRGLQDVFLPTVYTFISYWLIGFPLSYYLGMYTDLGSTGIWIGVLAGLTAAAILLIWRFNTLSNRLILSQEESLKTS